MLTVIELSTALLIYKLRKKSEHVKTATVPNFSFQNTPGKTAD